MAGLDGTLVVDLTQYAAGPAASRLLGELGATVIKVEPFTGDEQRTQGMAWGMNYKSEFDDVAAHSIKNGLRLTAKIQKVTKRC